LYRERVHHKSPQHKNKLRVSAQSHQKKANRVNIFIDEKVADLV